LANPDRPSGFKFVRDMHGASEPTIVYFDIGTVTGGLGRGHPCKIDGSGNAVELDGTFGNDDETAGTGIFICQKACVTGDTDVPFIPASDSIFEVQADDDAPWTTKAALKAYMNALGGTTTPWFQLTNATAAPNSLGMSICELAGASPHATAGYIRIVGWPDRPDNREYGAFQKVHVRWNSLLMEDSTDFVHVSI